MPPPPAIREQHHQDSRRARVRIGVAAALLVTAIGILTVLNHRKNEQVPAATPAEVSPQASMSSAEKENAPASASQAPADPVPAAAPTPEASPPPPPVTGKLPQIVPTATTKSAAPAAHEESTGAETSKPYVASASKALGQKDMSVVAVQSPGPAPAKPATAKAFEVQLGVFSDPENAKQLQTRLQEHGIPSHSETRVQLGPFKDRAEADRAREKLKALGIQAVVVAR